MEVEHAWIGYCSFLYAELFFSKLIPLFIYSDLIKSCGVYDKYAFKKSVLYSFSFFTRAFSFAIRKCII